MQTVNFNCPHCGNLMAVGTNLLGRNVRCPHCKQVVRAPAAPGEAPIQAPVPTPAPPPMPPSPSFNIPQQTEHHESIFGERHDEDVFGSEPLRPTFAPVQSAPLPPTLQEMPAPPPTPAPPIQPTYQPPPIHEPMAFDAPTVTAPYLPMPPDPYEQRAADRPPPREVEERSAPNYQARPRREEAPGTPAFAWILLVYAAIITIIAGFFGFQYFNADNKSEHPFKAMPDVIRQYDPAKKPQTAFQNMPDPKQEVPADLHVKLGGEIIIGDLKVQPMGVEKRKVSATSKYVSADDKTRSIGDTLVLTLHVKNMSADTTFYPNDPAFTRAVDSKQLAPYTALEVAQDFYYGVFKWPFEAGMEKEYIEGHEADEKPLAPGEERDTWVVVAPKGVRSSGSLDVMRTVFGDRQSEGLKPKDWLLWRVQLRRGMVSFQDGDKTSTFSATAVIGVEFQKDQIVSR